MSEKKGEVESDSKVDDSKEVDDKKSKTKKETKKSKQNNSVDENNENSKESSSPESKKTKTTKPKKATKKSEEAKNEEEHDDIEVEKKIPLLDQPPVIEGSRVRTTVLKFEPKPVVKLTVDLPSGKGKPLGKIPIVNQRLKRLRTVTVKHLHRLIFGKIGKVALILSNIQKFNGFPFIEDSDDYNRKVTALNKLPMDELKELVFSFDLDMKLRKKGDCCKEIVNFLISPKGSDKPQNTVLSHPKRKATKRNYFDADVEEEETRKRKKPKASADSKKEKSENDEKAKTTAKSSKTNDKSANDDASKNDDQDSSNELKKPAKKRKRNQIIEEEDNKKSKSQDDAENEKNDADGDDDDSEEGSATSDSSPAQKSGSSKDKLSDEELKIFLKKVLADLNLENTTMKTVYNLISSEYPTYDFSKKKRFIKGVVKSLIQ